MGGCALTGCFVTQAGITAGCTAATSQENRHPLGCGLPLDGDVWCCAWSGYGGRCFGCDRGCAAWAAERQTGDIQRCMRPSEPPSVCDFWCIRAANRSGRVSSSLISLVGPFDRSNRSHAKTPTKSLFNCATSCASDVYTYNTTHYHLYRVLQKRA